MFVKKFVSGNSSINRNSMSINETVTLITKYRMQKPILQAAREELLKTRK